jgi:hypothetical protein
MDRSFFAVRRILTKFCPYYFIFLKKRDKIIKEHVCALENSSKHILNLYEVLSYDISS